MQSSTETAFPALSLSLYYKWLSAGIFLCAAGMLGCPADEECCFQSLWREATNTGHPCERIGSGSVPWGKALHSLNSH